jgi:hypothetical protein
MSFVKGRSDKKFCSLHCKNAFNNRRYKRQYAIFKDADKYLHNNWKILDELYPASKGQKYIDPFILTSRAFKPAYNMGSDRKSIPGKTKYLIYDYAFIFEKELGVLIFKENE